LRRCASPSRASPTTRCARGTEGPSVIKDWRRFMNRFEKLQALGEDGVRGLLGVELGRRRLRRYDADALGGGPELAAQLLDALGDLGQRRGLTLDGGVRLGLLTSP
jgi:hypothetical protein